MLGNLLAALPLLSSAAVARADFAAPVTPEPAATNGAQDLKCTIAGGLAGTVAGVGVGAACWLLTKVDPCIVTGVTIASNVGGYITDKCNGAQN